jgi:hypothetical protein
MSILTYCNSVSSSIGDLPSWVPDWTKFPLAKPLPYHNFKATGKARDSDVSITFEEELHMQGIPIGRIRFLAPHVYDTVPLAPFNFTEDLFSEDDAPRQNGSNGFKIYLDTYLASTQPASRERLPSNWQEISNLINWKSQYAVTDTEITSAEAYWRTLFLDTLPQKSADVFELQRITSNISMCDMIDASLELKPIPDHFEPEITDTDARRTKLNNILKERLLDKTVGRSFYITDHGYFGLITCNSKPGDIVVALFGANVLFVLRKVDDHYIIIGEIYRKLIP